MKKNLKTQLVKLALLYIISAVCITIMLCACSTNKAITGKVDACPVKWTDNIHNPDNQEFVEEVAFNLDILASQVTQEQFNNRYLKTN